ncbi:MAG: hypothetical protein WAV23_00740, partial [Minisyncoccia bacterium]
MKKINFNSFLKSKNIFFVFISLLVFSLIGGVIFAQNFNPPSAPTNVTVTPSPCTSSTPHITITWPTVPPPSGITASIMYKVFRNADTDALVSSLTSPYYIDNSITTQTQYSYMVKAYYM